MGAVSFSFYTTAYGPPHLAHLLASADDHDDLRLAEELVDPWPEGFAFHVHRDQRSTRGVELCWESDQLQVRLLTLASPEDWELAFRLLEEAAGGQGRVRTEDGQESEVSELRERFGLLCAETNAGGAAFLVARIEAEQTHLTLPGPIRSFCIGPRVLEELTSAGPPDELTERLLERIREVQYSPEAERHYTASVLQASGEDELRFTLAAFGPGVRYLLPEVQFVALVSDEDRELFLDYDALLLLLTGWCRYLDERQVFVEALEGANWSAFLEWARRCALDPVAFLAGQVDLEAHAARVQAGALELAARLRPNLAPPPGARRAELDRTIELLEAARARDKEDLEVWSDLAAALGQRARLLSSLELPEAAVADQERAIRLLAKLARRNPPARADLALAYARRSDLAASQGQPRDACADLERAAAILEQLDEPREARLNLVACLCRQAELQAALGEGSQAEQSMGAAAAAADELDEDAARVRILRTRARIEPQLAATFQAEAYELAEAAALADPREVEEAFEVAADLWEGQLRRLQIRAAEASNARALRLLEHEVSAGRAQPSWISRVLSARAALLGAQLRHPEALAAAERCLALLQQLQAPQVELARAWDAIASAREDTGDLEGSLAAYDAALSCGDEDSPGLQGLERARGHVLRATIQLEAGRPERAEADLDAARRALEPRSRLPSQRWLKAGILHAEARQACLWGRFGEARQAAAQAVAVLDLLQDGDPMSEGFLAVVQVVLAEACLGNAAEEDARAAVTAAQTVLDRHEAAGLRLGEPTQAAAARIRAELARRAGQPSEGLALVDDALAGPARTGPPHRRAFLLASRGHALWDLGQREQARQAYAEARQLVSAPLRPCELCELLREELPRRGAELLVELRGLRSALAHDEPGSAGAVAWSRLGELLEPLQDQDQDQEPDSGGRQPE